MVLFVRLESTSGDGGSGFALLREVTVLMLDSLNSLFELREVEREERDSLE